MLVSVIVPIYNVEPYLNRCIDSILNQTYKNLEIILVDDGSTDRCGEICDEYEKINKQVTVIHKKNGGLSSARNAGLEIARGDYIGFVDSDDYIESDMYEKLISVCLESQCDVSSILYRRVDGNGNIYNITTSSDKDEFLSAEEYLKELLLHKGDVSVCSKLFKRSVVEELKFEVNKSNEDLLFMFEVIDRIAGIQIRAEVGYNYLVRSGSITNTGFSKNIIDMVDNSIYTFDYVKEKHSRLAKEANRFLLYQHMVYMLMIPKSQMSKKNLHYSMTLQNIRKFILINLSNPHLKIEEKVILVIMSLSPRLAKNLREYRKRFLK